MAQTESRRAVRGLIGDPDVVDRELQAFRRSARAFSTDRPRLIDEYEDRWVAVHKRKVVATAKTLDSVMKQVDAKHLPRKQVIVRRIARTPRTMIL